MIYIIFRINLNRVKCLLLGDSQQIDTILWAEINEHI